MKLPVAFVRLPVAFVGFRPCLSTSGRVCAELASGRVCAASEAGSYTVGVRLWHRVSWRHFYVLASRCVIVASHLTPHLLSPQFFLIFSKCFFTSVKFSVTYILTCGNACLQFESIISTIFFRTADPKERKCSG